MYMKEILVKESATKKEVVKELVKAIEEGKVELAKESTTIGQFIIKKIGSVITLF